MGIQDAKIITDRSPKNVQEHITTVNECVEEVYTLGELFMEISEEKMNKLRVSKEITKKILKKLEKIHKSIFKEFSIEIEKQKKKLEIARKNIITVALNI